MIHREKISFKTSPKLIGYCYPPEKARAARDSDRLLSLRVETSLTCNLRCNYCSLSTREHWPEEISYEGIIDVIDQASELGAESIVVIGGGEPTIYLKFRELIGYIHSHNMIPVVFTNTITMTREFAQFLYEHNASVIGKLDSLKEEVQDWMAGKRGTYQKIMRGLDNLMAVGFTEVDDPLALRLGVSFVINKVNIGELPNLWRFCRKRHIFPNLEMMIPNQRAANLVEFMPTKDEWKKAKLQILEIDRREFGFDWLPYTPLLGCGCLQMFYNLYLTVEGFIRPCAEVQIEGISIDDYTLEEIIHLPFFQLVRHVEPHLQGKCRGCVYNEICIGCRGIAFTVGLRKGMDPFDAVCAEDPTCFKA